MQVIKENNWLTEKEIEDISIWVKKEVDESVEFAENSPYPEAHELYEDVYIQSDFDENGYGQKLCDRANKFADKSDKRRNEIYEQAGE